MNKPHIRFLYNGWWAFNSRPAAYRANERGWGGRTPSEAYQRWRNFNRMKP